MTLSDLSIKRPIMAWMIMWAMIILGAISLGRLGISQLPDVEIPRLTINAVWEGAAPQILEAELVNSIEQAVISAEGLKDIESNIKTGRAQIKLEFDLNRDIDAAMQEVQGSLSRLRLPHDVDPPTIQKQNPDDNPILWLGISSPRPNHDLVIFVDEQIRDQFQAIPGVGEIMLGGFNERNLRIWVDNHLLRKYELTILDVQAAIQREHSEIAAGLIENSKKEMNLRVMGEGFTPDEIGNILIPTRGGRQVYRPTIRLRDVARIEDGLSDIRRISRVNGVPGISLGIKKQPHANVVEVARKVKERMAQLNQTLPSDVRLQVNYDASRFIEESVHETQYTLILSALITALVCWLFLGSWNSTLNVLLAIPTSILGTFIVIYFMGFTLNFFTLMGLALAVGIVVDDAIMVLENIVRHLQLGKHRRDAAIEGTREIYFAALAASVAVMAIFLPVIFMQGVLGRFFYQFGVTISAAVALSLLEALTLTPMRCSRYLNKQEQRAGFFGRVDRWIERVTQSYRSWLQKCLHHPVLTCSVALLLFAASMIIFSSLSREMTPSSDMSVFSMECRTPVGSSLEFTETQAKLVEKYLLSRDEVRQISCNIGMGNISNQINFFVTLKPIGERKLSQKNFMALCRKELSKIPNLKCFMRDLSMRDVTGGRGNPVEFNIRGPDFQVIHGLVQKITADMEKTGLMVDIDSDFREGMSEIRVVPDRARAAASGIGMETIGQTVGAAMDGVRQGKFTKGSRRYDVRISLERSQRTRAEDLSALQVRTSYGELVDLKDVASMESLETLQTLNRRMRERAISITANLASGKSQAAALQEVDKICKRHLPQGYRFIYAGNTEIFQEAIGSFLFVLFLGVLISYMILASQFNSLIHPFTVLLALPFSISGAAIALLLTGQSLNLYSGIGIILLMGIVKKNSIMLVEFTNQKRFLDGMPLREALLTAGPIRLRPILMTSIATVVAAIPPALALGPGAEIRRPMAITVIGGVILSTLFTLLVVPCAQCLLARWERNKSN